MPARLRRRQRLRTRVAFDRAFRRGRRLDGRLFTLIAAANDGEGDRLGLAVPRKVGGAVARNRTRRLLREGFRRIEQKGRASFDLVILAKPELAAQRLAEVERELRQRLQRLSPTHGTGGAGTRRSR